MFRAATRLATGNANGVGRTHPQKPANTRNLLISRILLKFGDCAVEYAPRPKTVWAHTKTALRKLWQKPGGTRVAAPNDHLAQERAIDGSRAKERPLFYERGF